MRFSTIDNAGLKSSLSVTNWLCLSDCSMGATEAWAFDENMAPNATLVPSNNALILLRSTDLLTAALLMGIRSFCSCNLNKKNRHGIKKHDGAARSVAPG